MRVTIWVCQGMIVWTAGAAAFGAPLKIAENGKSGYVIVTTPDAGKIEQFAVSELQKYLKQLTGAELAIVTKTGQGPWIAVGACDAAGKIEVPSRYEGDDAFRIVTQGSNLILKGADGRGTLYAVYAFLERQGCWFFTPSSPPLREFCEFIPRKPSLLIEPLDVLEQPLMKYRKKDRLTVAGTPQHDIGSFDWMGKNRCNTLAANIGEYERMRDAVIADIQRRGIDLHVGGHETMGRFMPADKYFKDHPEWFGMWKGARAHRTGGTKSKSVMFETGNPDAVAEFTRNLAAYLKTRPEITAYKLWPPDGTVWSESPESKAIGDPSERMATLFQQVSKGLREMGLTTRLAFLAYQGYVMPPANMKFTKNDIVDFCPIRADYSRPLDDPACEKNKDYWTGLQGWVKRFPGDIIHYSYYAKYSWNANPVALPEQIAYDVKSWAKLGEVGTDIYNETNTWLPLEVNHLAYARASYDPGFDAKAWHNAYLKARYGAAAEAMRCYNDLATQASLKGIIIGSRLPDPAPYLALVSQSRLALKEAAALADTPMAKWMIAKLSWKPDYQEQSIRLLMATAAKAPAKEIKAIQKEIADLVNLHRGDGTFIMAAPKKASAGEAAAAEAGPNENE